MYHKRKKPQLRVQGTSPRRFQPSDIVMSNPLFIERSQLYQEETAYGRYACNYDSVTIIHYASQCSISSNFVKNPIFRDPDMESLSDIEGGSISYAHINAQSVGHNETEAPNHPSLLRECQSDEEPEYDEIKQFKNNHPTNGRTIQPCPTDYLQDEDFHLDDFTLY